MTTPADPAATDAVADLRTTLKWIIAAAAGTATLLVGAGPLAAMGKLDDRGDATAAFGGLALAMCGIGWIIWQASEALMPKLVTLALIDDDELTELRTLMAADPPAFFGPYASLAELRARLAFHDTVAGNAAKMLSRESDDARAKMLQHTFETARANAEQARRLERRLLTLVHAWLVRGAVRKARRHAFVAMFVVLVGAVLFLTSTNDNPPDSKDKEKAKSATQLSARVEVGSPQMGLGRPLDGNPQIAPVPNPADRLVQGVGGLVGVDGA